MSLKLILKVTKNQSFTLSSEEAIFKKPQGCQIEPPQFLGLNKLII